MDFAEFDMMSTEPLNDEEVDMLKSMRQSFVPNLLRVADKVKINKDLFEDANAAAQDAINRVKFIYGDNKLNEELYYSYALILRIVNVDVFELVEKSILTQEDYDYLVSYITQFTKGIKDLM